MVKDIESVSEFNDLIDSGLPVVVKFWAVWCGPCKQYAPIFEKVSKDFEDFPEISAEYKVTTIPTTLVFNGGKVTQKMIGPVTPVALNVGINNGLV